jgi:hypothetical protein
LGCRIIIRGGVIVVSKVRAEPDSQVHYSYVSYDPSNNQTASGSEDFSHPGKFEGITYSNGRNHMNDCYHLKYRPTFQGGGFTRQFNDGSRDVFTNSPWIYGEQVAGKYGGPAPALPLNGVDQFVLRGVQAIKPKLKADVSVPNFLYELKDLRRLIPSSQTISDYAKALQGIYRNPFKGADNIAHATASQHLNAQFGYLPLIRDAFKLVEAINLFNLHVYEFKKRIGRPMTGHYRENAEGYAIEDVFIAGNDYTRIFRDSVIGTTAWTLTLKYSYAASIDKLGSPALFRRYLGFRGNPRILWDAIPFSFIVDWFVKFGKALESFDEGAIPVTLTITDACVSHKYGSAKKTYYADVPGATSTGSFGPRKLVASENYLVYSRFRIDVKSINLMDLAPLPVTDGLSVKELGLGLSLAKTLSHKR